MVRGMRCVGERLFVVSHFLKATGNFFQELQSERSSDEGKCSAKYQLSVICLVWQSAV